MTSFWSRFYASPLCLLFSVCLSVPTFPLLQDMHIISTDEKQVFAAVQEWNQNNTYSLYISDSPGVYFILSLENLRTSRGPAGNLLVDFYKVCRRLCSRTNYPSVHYLTQWGCESRFCPSPAVNGQEANYN